MTDNTDDLAIRILNEADDPDRFDNYADDDMALRYVRELKDERDRLREQAAGDVTVTLRLPAGARNDEPDGWTRTVRMSTVPYHADTIRVDGIAYRVHHVEHQPGDESSALYVVLR